MSASDIVTVWDRFGWIGFLGYVMVREVWPFVREKVWPVRVAQVRAERERMQRLEDRQLNAVDRQTAAIEAQSLAVQQMALAITTNNERLSTLIAGHAIHSTEMSEAIALMRERTGLPDRRHKGATL